MATLNTLHVTVEINGKDRKRPLRIFDAKTGKLGVVVAGACVPVTPAGQNRVKLDDSTLSRVPDTCRAAKLADLGIEAKAKPASAQAAHITGKLTPELATQMIAMLQAYLAD